MKNKGTKYLTAGEFLPSGRDGLDLQVAQARWQLLLSIQRMVPEFFEKLRDDVLGAFFQARQTGVLENWVRLLDVADPFRS